jgi:hypothetical protein
MKKTINRGAYKRKSQAEGSSICFTVYQKMTTDPQFAPCKDKVDEMKTRRDAYEIANANAVNGGSILIGQKNTAFDFLMEQIDKVADDVEMLADGDTNIAQAAGFPIVKAAEAVTDLSMPKGLEVVNAERSGFIKVSFKSDNAVNYGIETQEEEGATPTGWKNGIYTTSSRNNIFGGYKPGVYLLVRMYSMGRRGLKSEATDPVRVLVI